MTFSGTAPAESRWGGVAINGGLTVVEATHDGPGEFGVSLENDGGQDYRFVDATGNYDGAAAELVTAGEYVLHVEKDEEWEVVIRQPRPESGDPLPVSPSGAGPTVLGPFDFEGTHTATLSHDGQGESRVRVLPVEGGSGEVLLDGPVNGEEEATFEHSGIGYINVDADGDWSLDLR
ncbi:hypothetical protein BRD00_04075 [Halobacteriales archaeon QS_8_69_26]|nr:MAG: hypothetical protein BRD00_04075 [Halobacteriales archaeon QS_8_69_26]